MESTAAREWLSFAQGLDAAAAHSRHTVSPPLLRPTALYAEDQKGPAMNVSQPAATGRNLGPYSIVRKLGSGGFGTTYLASRTFENGLTKQFALKQIHHFYGDPEARRAEFRDEARILSLLDAHPGIVQLVDYFGVGEDRALVMEYVNGLDLHAVQRYLRSQHPRRRLPHAICTFIAAEICSALAYAHTLPAQVVHRDLAPANIFLGFDGHVKLGDFGIATFIGRPKHTATGKIKGRLMYMSPEHIDRARGIDAQSDLFSLGAVLYEMLSGAPAFNLDSPESAFYAILHGKFVPLGQLLPDIDPELALLVHELLSPNKALRPESAAEVRKRLMALPARSDARDVLAGYVRECLQGNASSDDSDASEDSFNYVSGEQQHPPAEVATDSPPSRAPSRPAPPARAPSALAQATHELGQTSPARSKPAAGLRQWHRVSVAAAIGAGAAYALYAAVLMAPAQHGASAAPSKPQPPPAQAEAAASPAPAWRERPPTPVEPPAEGLDSPVPTEAIMQPSEASDQGERREQTSRHRTRVANLSVIVHNYGFVKVDDEGPFKSPLHRLRVQAGLHHVRIYEDKAARNELRHLQLDLAPGESKEIEIHATDAR
jgi:serine/threonine protein kinase